MRFIVLIIAIFTSLYSSSIVSGSFHKMKTLQSSKGYKIVELNNIPYTEYVNNKLIFKATTGDIVFYYLKNQDRKQTNDGVTYNIKSYAYQVNFDNGDVTLVVINITDKLPNNKRVAYFTMYDNKIMVVRGVYYNHKYK